MNCTEQEVASAVECYFEWSWTLKRLMNEQDERLKSLAEGCRQWAQSNAAVADLRNAIACSKLAIEKSLQLIAQWKQIGPK